MSYFLSNEQDCLTKKKVEKKLGNFRASNGIQEIVIEHLLFHAQLWILDVAQKM